MRNKMILRVSNSPLMLGKDYILIDKVEDAMDVSKFDEEELEEIFKKAKYLLEDDEYFEAIVVIY